MRLFEISNESVPIVYVDMDGVLVDTYNPIAKIMGVSHYNNITPDQWEEFYSKLDAYTFFKNLPMFPTATRLLQIVTQFSGKFSILSSPLNYDVAGSIRGKKEWLKMHNIHAESVVFESAKELYATSNNIPNILIDDSPSQITRWKSAGGIAIPYQADKDDVNSVKSALNIDK
jgi:5'(3')-deoxyribonucleotidase